jgi:hypothetical protein
MHVATPNGVVPPGNGDFASIFSAPLVAFILKADAVRVFFGRVEERLR